MIIGGKCNSKWLSYEKSLFGKPHPRTSNKCGQTGDRTSPLYKYHLRSWMICLNYLDSVLAEMRSANPRIHQAKQKKKCSNWQLWLEFTQKGCWDVCNLKQTASVIGFRSRISEGPWCPYLLLIVVLPKSPPRELPDHWNYVPSLVVR